VSCRGNYDAVHPCGEIRARREAVFRSERLGRDILYQVVCRSAVARQCKGPSSHLRQEINKLILELVGHPVKFPAKNRKTGSYA
jgi:hypothetical protein